MTMPLPSSHRGPSFARSSCSIIFRQDFQWWRSVVIAIWCGGHSWGALISKGVSGTIFARRVASASMFEGFPAANCQEHSALPACHLAHMLVVRPCHQGHMKLECDSSIYITY